MTLTELVDQNKTLLETVARHSIDIGILFGLVAILFGCVAVFLWKRK